MYMSMYMYDCTYNYVNAQMYRLIYWHVSVDQHSTTYLMAVCAHTEEAVRHTTCTCTCTRIFSQATISAHGSSAMLYSIYVYMYMKLLYLPPVLECCA